MQGIETEQGVISALDKIAINYNIFDLVVIIRGGGSQTDLSWFDNYNIAYHITQFPLPVITGIGHDKDMSVTDMVANKSLKTPTAVADLIIESMASAENQLTGMSSEIRDLTRAIIDKNTGMIDTVRIKLLPVARIMISETKEKLSGRIMEINRIGKEYTSKAGLVIANQSSRLVSSVRSFSSGKVKETERSGQSLITLTLNSLNTKNTRLQGLENTLNILRPENVLQRGYTITSLNGRILKKSIQLKNDDIIDTLFSDGTISSRVVNRDGSDIK
jgi:exodeoxyribonuclease VII large subunit